MLKPIKNKRQYEDALVRVYDLMQKNVKAESKDSDELEILSILVKEYELQHYPVPNPSPLEAIKFRLDQQGLTTRDLEPFIGSSGRVSEVLNRKRKLSLSMVKRLHDGLRIPYESLLS